MSNTAVSARLAPIAQNIYSPVLVFDVQLANGKTVQVKATDVFSAVEKVNKTLH